MKKTFLVLITLIILTGCNQNKEDNIIIGAILPLTGNSANIGLWQSNGIEMAVGEIFNKTGKTVQIHYEDSQSQPKTGLNAFMKLSQQIECDAYMFSISSIANSIIPQMNNNPKPSVLLAVSLPNITDKSEYAIRYNIGSDDEAKAMANHLIKNNYKKMSVLYLIDEFGTGANDVFNNAYTSQGGIINFSSGYNPDQTDFKSLIIKLKEFENEGVYVIGYKRSSVLLIKQLKELGFLGQVIGNMALSIPSYLELGGNSMQNAIFTVTNFGLDSLNNEYKDFVKHYHSRFKESPTFFAGFAYDAIMVLFKNHTKDITPADYIEILKSVKDYPGVMGETTINSNGTVDFPVNIVTNNNDKLLKIQ